MSKGPWVGVGGILSGVLGLSVTANVAAGGPATRPADGPVHVACVGDSITYGWTLKDRDHDSYPAQLQRMLGDGYAVANYGVSGCTMLSTGDSPYVKQQAYQDALAGRPDVVIIALGTNDTKPQNWAHHATFSADYSALIKSFRTANPHVKVYVCDPPPAFPENFGIRDSIIAGQVCPTVNLLAARDHATVINLHAALAKDSADFPDKIHPNAAGAQKLAETVFHAVHPRP